ncbi:Zinc finger A20 and AN1 domain-containing stress-associated protein [Melia azedarach]|uniref:Zinc finger A20 and AN1 domain-containing stress-associated protein n=1 Tax=Melia azedarach TaxID=155640 RepID=A0ACC1X3Y5_MELAZ|nr:Zinc finger A20 and AN1 domain-containing stress-associated protein [Melia azedarach]
MGCGFHRTKESKNMCSKCYKDFHKSSPPDSSLGNPPNPSVVLVDSCPTPQPTASISETSTTVTSGSATANPSRAKNRCQNCNKKVGLTGFKCRCGMHRYPKEHSCAFDFKKIDREILVENNPLIKPDILVDRI